MAEEVLIDGKTYITSKRASDLTGYAQDYIGQLARSGAIDAKRLGGLWYVFAGSITTHKERAEEAKTSIARREFSPEADSLLMLDGKAYVSAARASEISGYNKDYVGQLARSGKILSRRIGNRWYVERGGLLGHKEEKDSLLAAVQAESVGVRPVKNTPTPTKAMPFEQDAPYLTYHQETADLMPTISPKEADMEPERPDVTTGPDAEAAQEEEEYRIPIHVTHTPSTSMQGRPRKSITATTPTRKRDKTMFYATMSASALTFVIILSLGLQSLRGNASYAAVLPAIKNSPLTASVISATSGLGDILEALITRELIYKRN